MRRDYIAWIAEGGPTDDEIGCELCGEDVDDYRRITTTVHERRCSVRCLGLVQPGGRGVPGDLCCWSGQRTEARRRIVLDARVPARPGAGDGENAWRQVHDVQGRAHSSYRSAGSHPRVACE